MRVKDPLTGETKQFMGPSSREEAIRLQKWNKTDFIPLTDCPFWVQETVLRGHPTNNERRNLIGFVAGNGGGKHTAKRIFGTVPWAPAAMDRAAWAQVNALTAEEPTESAAFRGHTYWDVGTKRYRTLQTDTGEWKAHTDIPAARG